MGLFTIVKVPDYQVIQGDTEVLSFEIAGYELKSWAATFKGSCPTGTIEKGTSLNGIYDNSDITITEFTDNKQTLTVNFAADDFKSMQGTMKYQIQISTDLLIYTIIEGNIIIKPEIIK